jgi:peptide-methionine (S)-S-oxide reductase
MCMAKIKPKIKEIATFAAGCFWGVEEMYRTLPGVLKTTVGYTGGTMPNATYEQVCTGATGHAEAVEITFDPFIVSYDALLTIFWESHDPTTKNRQGWDVGSQYRSAIFYHSQAQKRLAEASKTAMQEKLDTENKKSLLGGIGGFGKRIIVTQILPVQTFWPAEEYHQKYLAKRGAKVCH